MPKRVTLAEVGRRVGVSPITVSAALGLLSPDTPVRVSVEKAQRIREVAAEMGYQANLVARALRQKETHTIGVLFRSVHAPSVMSVRIDMLNRELGVSGYRSHLAVSRGNMDDLALMISDLLAWQVDGLIIHDLFQEENDARWVEIERSLGTRKIPLVMVESSVAMTVPCASITVDHLAGGQAAAEHLLELGHRKLAFLGSIQGPPGQRLAGAQRAAAGVPGARVESYGYVYSESFEDPIEGVASAARVLAESFVQDMRGVTGVLCANDLIAGMVVSGLQQRGLRVPEDVSVVGYDDAEYARVTNPGLTSMHVFGAQTGREAAELILEQVKKPGTHGRKLEKKPRLVVRGSTAKVRG
jgi:LacI family transcriptional regulator